MGVKCSAGSGSEAKRGSGVCYCEEDVVEKVSRELGVEVATLYFRIKCLHGYHYIEVVLKCRELADARKVAEKLGKMGLRVERESNRALVMRRLHDVRKFVEEFVGIEKLPPKVRACYESRYRRRRKVPIRREVAPALKPLIEWITNVGFHVVANRYPQLRITFTSPEAAAKAMQILREVGCTPAKGRGKRARTLEIYRLRDVRMLVEGLLDEDRLPPNFLKAYRRSMKSPHMICVNRDELIKRPELWRIIGLILGDNYTGLNSFANTNERLVKHFVKNALALFPPEAVWISWKVDQRPNRKPLWKVTIRGEPGRIVADIAEKAQYMIHELDAECFWQLVTGLYEADGSVSIRYPSATYRVPYPDVNVKLSEEQKALAEAVARRLVKEGINARVREHSNCYEIRITSKSGFAKFFERIDPVIKNPKDLSSFEGTRTRPETATVIATLFAENARPAEGVEEMKAKPTMKTESRYINHPLKPSFKLRRKPQLRDTAGPRTE